MNQFKWGLTSKLKLRDLHPDGRRVLDTFIKLSPVDCTVLEVKRSLARQKQLFASKATRTMESRHLANNQGIVHAADVVPLVAGKVCWQWEVYYDVARAMQEAVKIENVSWTWGGVWDRKMNDFDQSIELEVAAYVARMRALKKPAFLDGPHNQLAWDEYP